MGMLSSCSTAGCETKTIGKICLTCERTERSRAGEPAEIAERAAADVRDEPLAA